VAALALLAGACGESRTTRDARLAREQRIGRLLGLHPPYHANGASFDDCGVGATRIRANGDSLDVFLDRRAFRPDSTGSPPASYGRV